jgi:ElaB/YqjD/DUF883 family membrane-anchored ribosome-binding protein
MHLVACDTVDPLKGVVHMKPAAVLSPIVAKVRIDKAVEKTKDISADVGEALEQRFKQARRTMRRAKGAAEDRLDDARSQIKKNPLRSVAVSTGGGIAIGFLAGWLARGRRR